MQLNSTVISQDKRQCKMFELTSEYLWAMRQRSSLRAITVSWRARFSCCQLIGGLMEDLSMWSGGVNGSSEF